MNPVISNYDLLQLASGDTLSLQVYKFIGKQPGKKVYIQSNLHGAEIVGNAVIQQLIEFLSTLNEEQIIDISHKEVKEELIKGVIFFLLEDLIVMMAKIGIVFSGIMKKNAKT